MSCINVLLVEDQTLTRMGISLALNSGSSNCRIVAEAGSVHEAKELLKQLEKVDIVLLDLMLPDGNGTEIVQFLRSRGADTKVLVISADTTRENILQLIDLGIGGFISKFADISTLEAAITSVYSGIEYYGKDITEILHAVSTAKAQALDIFTSRELDIMRYCAKGLSVKQISEELNISTRTVENHKNNIFKKLGFNSTAELINYVFEHGIVHN
ncbi:MAG: response regulator transcription factor [Bacteroidales bacterium]|jgi:DNA-binding NarL/FixJ family response regulator|nr:response regulator transcription factor [Bacteroidales bacterium]MBR3572149.1 response regulator transcription factor [Bacteroidales bacterium]